MNSFITKKIVSHQTVPETLRNARFDKEDELIDIARKIKIQEHYLAALEDGAYEKIPGDIYARQWLKAYGQYLNLDTRWLIKEYEREKGVQMQFLDFKKYNQEKKHWLFWLTPKTIKIVGLAIITIAFASYLGMEIRNILQPPMLVINNPTNNLITEEGVVSIEGQTDIEIEITINNEIILADQNGVFSKEIYLSPGINTLEIVATKKHGRANKQIINIFRHTVQADINSATISYTIGSLGSPNN
ncbi:MAG: hypothetical protein AUJ28_01905 [Parcubacteria group bacterium CG1_02_37_51]|uniref:HTH cro/C1-type domain-containing protein n=3 Tax=Candidatus Komeiliibacteriota TaxID=1817908 RepID=A0A2M7RBR5_9BACT|nr:MAG: hypothetical protein AUJ28_01905 [Parcubacteria group bacterium CG1_02_37_51]PIY94213.1 MAG: hypothetical protein COY67_03040 [Candidatus Komeilibacteria bacterium CG_4_10_14_0_8_um_filter_37_78]